jgi:thiamine-monophosphate kinase
VAVSGLGEFELIDRLASLVAGAPPPELKIGIGDDAAAWATAPNTMTVATADALVEGVHFDLATTSWRDLGWKALAENVSDVAAMGCLPRYAFVTLALSPATPIAGVEDLYRGMGECARAYDCTVAGGDVVRAPCLMLSVTLIGTSAPAADRTGVEEILLRRAGAIAGDVIAVTGPLGGSAAGLRLLQSGWREGPPADPADAERALAARVLVETHRRPRPRVAAGQALVAAGVRCAIDVSDGLVADVGHICEQSDLDAELIGDRIPIHAATVTCFNNQGLDNRGLDQGLENQALELALTGGEDYELVGVGSADRVAAASAALVAQGEPALRIIGVMQQRTDARPQVRLRKPDGALMPMTRGGYRHF